MPRFFLSLEAREKSLIISAGTFALVGIIILGLFLLFDAHDEEQTFPGGQTREEQLRVIESLRALSAQTPPVEEEVKERVRADLKTIRDIQDDVSESEKEAIRSSLRQQ